MTDEDDVPNSRFIESVYYSTCHVVYMSYRYNANGLVYSRENNTDVRSMVPKRQHQADFTNASPFHHY